MSISELNSPESTAKPTTPSSRAPMSRTLRTSSKPAITAVISNGRKPITAPAPCGSSAAAGTTSTTRVTPAPGSSRACRASASAAAGEAADASRSSVVPRRSPGTKAPYASRSRSAASAAAASATSVTRYAPGASARSRSATSRTSAATTTGSSRGAAREAVHENQPPITNCTTATITRIFRASPRAVEGERPGEPLDTIRSPDKGRDN
ncbi:hypothetical protein [Streptomyces eurocidicus]|uniref:hypothetical protein n=1 Tax=Streptomyces eurocidicus TaxID=66423 RepID=UPI0011AF0B09|nr:hypothetical protein [Streptomyces eurocidicus]MBF6050965.1 hypothetical protein [Streptomyces eurocidicus]